MSALLGQQLDMFGGRHDIVGATETLRLFASAPQIRGQINMDTDAASVQSQPPEQRD